MSKKCKECDKQSRDKTNDSRAISARALKLMAALPDNFTCNRNFPESTANFLCAARDFAAECSMAHTWTEEEFRIRHDALKLADATSDYVEVLARPVGGGKGERTTADCVKEKLACISACDQDDDSGYTCYLDCRLAYYACLAGTIVGLGGSGGIIAA
jgi:hypothetical protein